MDNSNYPTPPPDTQSTGKSSKNVFIVVLAIAFLASLGYAVFSNNSKENMIEQQKTQIAKVSDEKSEVQKSFDESLTRLDSMASMSNGLKSKLSARDGEIASKKAEIRSILNKKNATAAELGKAKELIGQLNDKITNMEKDVARLTQDNQVLTQDKEVLTQDKEKLTSDLTTTTQVKEDLEKKVDVASTLNASNISITPVDVKSNGKEKETSTAKRVNKLVISFDVDNRIAPSGSTDVYVCILGPDGKPVTTQSNGGSGTFTTREEGDKSYTAKLQVDIETAKNKNVKFAFTGSDFQKGNYKIEIYQNGFKIGEGTRELKKGGLFS
jgi:hypothetical protein